MGVSELRVPKLRHSCTASPGAWRLTDGNRDLRLEEALQKFQKAQSMNVTEKARSRIQIESTKSLCIGTIPFPLSECPARGWSDHVVAESALTTIRDETL
jgi:hypothetical protein